MTLLSGSLTLLGTAVVPFARIFDRFSGSAALALVLVSGSRRFDAGLGGPAAALCFTD